MPIYSVQGPDGKVYDVQGPEGATADQLGAFITQNAGSFNAGQATQPNSSAPPAGYKVTITGTSADEPQTQAGGASGSWAPGGFTLDNLQHQLGLTGRAALTGVTALPNMIWNGPIGALNAALGTHIPMADANATANALGLPQPQNGQERIVQDAASGVASLGLPLGAATKALDFLKAPEQAANALPSVTDGMTRNVLAKLTASPAAQIGGGVGGSVASGEAQRENVGPLGQAAAAIGGGLLGGIGGAATSGLSRGVAGIFDRVSPSSAAPRAMSTSQLSQAIQSKLGITGPDWDALSALTKNGLLSDVRKAGNLNSVDPDALRRLADMRELDVTPTRGTITLDPVQITREKNLAKTGANSNQANLQGLAQTQNANNQRLVQLLQGMEGKTETLPVRAGQAVMDDIAAQRDGLRRAEAAAWDEAKASPGYTMPMQAHVLSDINAALDEQGLMPFMDKGISSYIEALQTNPERFTPQAYRNLQSMLSRAMKGGGNEAAAAGVARDALNGAELKPAATQILNPDGVPVTGADAQFLRATDGLPSDAMRAIDVARAATRNAYEFEKSSPLVNAVLSDGAPADATRIAQRFVINGTPGDAANLASNISPASRKVVRDALATYIKKRALGGASDEVGTVSQRALNSTLRQIGDEKLGLFFTPEEVAQLHRIGRVASYLQTQPAGSAVNNSNSGAMIMGRGIDALAGLAGKVPLLNIDQQINSLVNGVYYTPRAMNVGRGLLAPRPRVSLLSSAARGAQGGMESQRPLLGER